MPTTNMAITIAPTDTATLIYHDAMRRAEEAIDAYRAAANARIEADQLADSQRAILANAKARAILDAIDGKTEATRAAAVTIALDADEDYQRIARDLADTERRVAEMRVEAEAATMAHSVAKRQLEFAAATIRVLS